jgi:hypothetical protein
MTESAAATPEAPSVVVLLRLVLDAQAARKARPATVWPWFRGVIPRRQ